MLILSYHSMHRSSEHERIGTLLRWMVSRGQKTWYALFNIPFLHTADIFIMAGIGTIMKADEAQGQVQRFRDDDLEQEPDQRLREGEFQTLHLGTQRVYSGQTLDGVPYGLGAEFGEMIAVPAPVQIEEAGVGPPKQAVYLGGFREGAKDGWGVDCLANGERFVGWCASGERSGYAVSPCLWL